MDFDSAQKKKKKKGFFVLVLIEKAHCLSYFSVTVQKCHDQGNLFSKHLIVVGIFFESPIRSQIKTWRRIINYECLAFP